MFSLDTDDRVMTQSLPFYLSSSAWPTSPSVQRQPRTRRDESAVRLLTATNAGACRASTQASSPWKHSCPTQTERNSARCRNDALDYDTSWSWFEFPSLGSFVHTILVLTYLFGSPPIGGYPAADGRLHLRLRAGKDAAPGTEQPAQTLHPGSSLSDCASLLLCAAYVK